jgi:hypothetical protein
MSELSSPLARLVLFMIVLSVAGSLVAGLQYFIVDIPRQNAMLLPPGNDGSSSCVQDCYTQEWICSEGAMVHCIGETSRWGSSTQCEIKYREACADATYPCIKSCPI